MNAIHKPSAQFPLNTCQKPNRMISHEISTPPPTAICVARRRLRVMPHTMARRMRPPSSGKPGSRLKSASTALILASQLATSLTARPKVPVGLNCRVRKATAPKTAASARLVSGPASAIRNSSRARRGSALICAAPPKMNSVIRGTGTPCAFETRLCASSCASTDAKNSRLVASAKPQRSSADHSRCTIK